MDADQIEQLEFTVLGNPVQQGSKTGFVVGKRAVIVDQNKVKLKPWRAHVRQAAETALAGRTGLDDACFVHLDFYMRRPKTVHRRRPSVKPDIDKLTRAILDSLTDAAVIKDDALVVALHVQQWYADDEPYVRIKVGELA
jgi:Holliday junction resolvase RusA-like endonuclease